MTRTRLLLILESWTMSSVGRCGDLKICLQMFWHFPLQKVKLDSSPGECVLDLTYLLLRRMRQKGPPRLDYSKDHFWEKPIILLQGHSSSTWKGPAREEILARMNLWATKLRCLWKQILQPQSIPSRSSIHEIPGTRTPSHICSQIPDPQKLWEADILTQIFR